MVGDRESRSLSVCQSFSNLQAKEARYVGLEKLAE